MKNLRVISLTVVMALSTLVAAHGNRTQETQRVGAVVGYLVEVEAVQLFAQSLRGVADGEGHRRDRSRRRAGQANPFVVAGIGSRLQAAGEGQPLDPAAGEHAISLHGATLSNT